MNMDGFRECLDGLLLSDIMWLAMNLPIDEAVFTDFQNKLIGLILACDEKAIEAALEKTGIGRIAGTGG